MHKVENLQIGLKMNKSIENILVELTYQIIDIMIKVMSINIMEVFYKQIKNNLEYQTMYHLNPLTQIFIQRLLLRETLLNQWVIK